MKLILTSIIGCLFTTSAFCSALHSAPEIEKLVKTYIEDEIQEKLPKESDFEIEISSFNLNSKHEECQNALNAEMDNGDLTRKNISVKISCSHPKWVIRVPVKLKRFENILVANQQLIKDQFISEEELSLVRHEINDLRSEYYQSIEDVKGKIAQKNIPSGSIIKPNMIKPATIIRRGETVRIVAIMPGLSIEMMGIAQTDATKGQVIKIKNSRSNKLVDAIAIEPGVAQITI